MSASSAAAHHPAIPDVTLLFVHDRRSSALPATLEARRPASRRERAGVFFAGADSALAEVVRGHLHGDPVAREDTDPEFLQTAGAIAESFVPIIEPHPKSGVGQALQDGAVEFEEVFLGHASPS